MAQKRTKKEIVQMLLKNNQLENQDEEQLMEILFDEPIAIDVDKQAAENETWQDRLADRLTEICGSWGFIIWFIFIIALWMTVNIVLAYKYTDKAFDPYPFILLNLILSCISALQAPIIMMSQNRQSKKDTLRSKNDYRIDLKSELILEELHDKMEIILANQKRILKYIEQEAREKE